jgi:hypothetical protein
MPLRKKHVRRIVVIALMLGVFLPLVGLAAYAVSLRSGAYGRAVAAGLESRLRCTATVTGARPTGPSTAAADAVELTWQADQGRLTLRLEGLKAESNAYGWYVRAARGSLSHTGHGPAETLAALNQRLVQRPSSTQLVSLVVDRLELRLDMGNRSAKTEVRAAVQSNATAYAVTFFDPAAFEAAARTTAGEVKTHPLATLRLNPTSERGVFESLQADARQVPLACTVAGTPASHGDLSMDVAAAWDPSAAPSRPATIQVVLHFADMAAWTKAVPGGPITGKGDLALACTRSARGPAEWLVGVEAKGGRLAPETLAWLSGLGAGLRTAKLGGAAPLDYDLIAVTCRATGDRARFEGRPDSTGGIPLVTTRLLGVELPLLWASPRSFSTSEVRPALEQALGLEAAASPPTSAVPAAKKQAP